MILPNNNISIMDVRNITGYPSMDLGSLCAKAKIGGKSGYAFNIKENGGATTDGSLIPGAEPYWNIYSNNSPAKWSVTGQQLKLKLLRDNGGNNYCFSLGGFRGYNHNAVKPYIFQEGSEIYLQQSSSSVPVGITIFWEFGEVDWKKALNSNFDAMQIYAARTYLGSPVISEKIKISDYNQLGHYTINKNSYDFVGFNTGDPLYFWADFYNGSAKLANFPVYNKGYIKWAEYWQKNKLGNVQVVYQQNNYNIASNYSVINPSLDDSTTKITFSIYKTADDSYNVTPSKCYIRCKWRDKTSWQDCPKYSIDLPNTNFTRTCWADLPMRADKSEYLDIQLVLV